MMYKTDQPLPKETIALIRDSVSQAELIEAFAEKAMAAQWSTAKRLVYYNGIVLKRHVPLIEVIIECVKSKAENEVSKYTEIGKKIKKIKLTA